MVGVRPPRVPRRRLARRSLPKARKLASGPSGRRFLPPHRFGRCATCAALWSAMRSYAKHQGPPRAYAPVTSQATHQPLVPHAQQRRSPSRRSASRRIGRRRSLSDRRCPYALCLSDGEGLWRGELSHGPAQTVTAKCWGRTDPTTASPKRRRRSAGPANPTTGNSLNRCRGISLLVRGPLLGGSSRGV